MNLIQIYVKDDATNFQEIVPYVGAYGEGHIRVRLITQFTGETSWFAKFKKPNSLKTTNLLMIDTGLTEQVEVSPGVFENWKTFERTVDGNVFDIDSAVSQNVKGSFDYWFVSSDGLGIVNLSTDLFNVFPSALVSEYARVADTATDWVYQDVVNATTILTGNSIKITTVGTTDYTLIGAPNNNVGTIFVATGVPTGTGTAEVWVDSEVELAEDVTRVPTELYDIPVDPNFEAQPSQPLTNEEIIIDELKDHEARIEDLEDGEQVSSTFEEIKVKDPITGDVAIITYKHTNGNNYQVVQIEYPDGRVEEINEVHEYNYRNVTGVTLNSGIVLMTDGMTQGNQAVDGYLWDEGSIYSQNLVGVVTVDGIANLAKSKATYLGIVHGIAESDLFVSGTAYDEGQIIYARQGKISNVAPAKPNRILRLGAIINKVGTLYDVVLAPLIFERLNELSNVEITNEADGDAVISRGGLFVNENLDTKFSNLETLYAKRNTIMGTFQTTLDLLYAPGTSDYVMTNADGVTDSIVVDWSDGPETIDLTDFRFAPTFGTDTVPVENCLYVLKSDTSTGYVNSSFPSEEYAPVSKVSLFSEVTTNAENTPGGPKNQNINNHQKNLDQEGFNRIVGARFRVQGILYKSGLGGPGSDGWIDDVAGTLYFQHAPGVAYQFNRHVIPEKYTNPAGGPSSLQVDIHIPNDSASPYKKITEINDVDTDASGNLIGTGKYFNLVFHTLVNKTDEYSPLYMTLPTDVYLDETDAKNDSSNYSVFELEEQFRLVAQPICIVTLRKGAGAALTFVQSTDIRSSNNTFGGGGVITNDTSFFDSQFELKNTADPDKKAEFDLSQITTLTKRTQAIQDKDGTLAHEEDLVLVEDRVEVLENKLDNSTIDQTYDELHESTFGVIDPITGSPELVEALGLSLTQQNVDGDIATSLVVTATGQRISLKLDGTIYANNTYTVAEQTYDLITGNIYFARFKSSDGLGLLRESITIAYSDASFVFEGSATDDFDNVFIKFTATKTLKANIKFAGTLVNSGTLERVDQTFYDITNTPLASHTASQLNNIIDTYIEDTQSIVDFSLQSIGKNLLDEKNLEQGGWNVTVGDTYEENKSASTSIVRVISTIDILDTAYAFSFEDTDYELTAYANYDDNDLFVSWISVGASSGTFTPISSKVVLGFIKGAGGDITPDDIKQANFQLEQGSVATTYAPYNTDTISFPNTTLRSVDTAIRDRIYEDNGVWKLEQNVGYVANESVEETINYADMPTGGVFEAVDILTFEIQTGIKGDALTLTNASNVRYELTDKVDTLIDKDGGLIQENPTTLIQTELSTECTLKFNLDSSAQIITNTHTGQNNTKQNDLTEGRVDVLEPIVATHTTEIGVLQNDRVVAFTGSAAISSSTSEPAANITTTFNVSDYDKAIIKYKDSGVNFMSKEINIAISLRKKVKSEDDIISGITLNDYKFYLKPITDTTIAVWNGERVVTTYGSPAGIVPSARAGMTVEQIVFIRN